MFTAIIVSKPVRRWDPASDSPAAELPASTVQLRSSVAPFQLAYTTDPPA